jgi:hypothetical protein
VALTLGSHRYPGSIVNAMALALLAVIATPIGAASAAEQLQPADMATTQGAKPSDSQTDVAQAVPSTSPMPMTVEDVMQALQPSGPGQLGRWFDISTAALGLRYRTLESNAGSTANDLQNTVAFRGQFKLDRTGRYAVHGRLASGQGFNGGWNNTGIGTSPRSEDLFVKELFVNAQPIHGLELQAGGLYISRGESTEATSYDNDGYIVGERVTIRRGVGSILDDVSVTRAFLGDLTDANVFTRLGRLDRANYYQAQAVKRLGRGASVSADYTRQAAAQVVRTVVNIDMSKTGVVDRLKFENYARVDPMPAFGYAVAVQRHIMSRFMAGGGFSDIDSQYGPLNSDLNRTGRRVYGSISGRIGSAWLGSVQVARAVGSAPLIGPRTRLDVALGLDLLRARVATERSGR